MAANLELVEGALEEWQEWLATRPETVRAVAEKYPPWILFRLKATGQRGNIEAYAEDGTVRMSFTGEYNLHMHDKEVFGLDPKDLEECDLPGPDEEVGSMLETQEQVDGWIDMIRPFVLARKEGS